MRAFLATMKFCRDQRGATAIEYALIASLLSVAILSALLAVNGSMGSLFDGVFTRVHNALVGGS